MFESLQTGLQSALKSLQGKGKLTESNMREALALVEQSLIEADVSYDVVREFVDNVTEQSLGERVLLSLDPSQLVFKIVYDELVSLLGPVDSSLHLTKDVNVLMMCGLQGSGKTTTCGKLSRMLLENKVTPLLVAADLQRPAAIDQLHVLGEQLGVPVYSERGSKDPVAVCRNAVEQARRDKNPVVILDTAGRLAIDEALMAELQHIDNKVQPDQVYLVVDGMTGQDAVNSAQAFNDALELDGVIMTKLDGDARGGALLSVKKVTGVPIKFIGTGEHLDALEPFQPEGMASRILGQGDIAALAREAGRIISEEEREDFERKMAEGVITLEDFRGQLLKFAQPGLMQKMLALMPGMGQLSSMMQDENTEGGVRRMVGIIDSMTPRERRLKDPITPARRNRIAQGAGVQASEVNQLVKQFDMMRPLLQGMAGQGVKGRMDAFRELQSAGMLDPGSRGPRMKKATGKRLSPKEKAKAKKLRDKAKRRARRKGK